ncbi:MAG TPA: hypothetical protein VHC22_19040 [Pirellulales bacterium]|nr:hypothetical protein [Pirellulales bacterium]
MAVSLSAAPADGPMLVAGPAFGPLHAVGAILPLAVTVLGVFLLFWHRRSWQAVVATAAETGEVDFQRRRYRRRMRTSGLLVLLGIAMAGGQSIPAAQHPTFFVLYWCAVAVLTAWMMVLAVGDAFATRMHWRREWQRHVIERAKLSAELQRLKSTDRTNGRPSSES